MYSVPMRAQVLTQAKIRQSVFTVLPANERIFRRRPGSKGTLETAARPNKGAGGDLAKLARRDDVRGTLAEQG
jgi:hypothetical protein